MKRKYCLLAILWPVLNATAQPVPAPRPLTIGDTVPEVFFDSVLHYSSATAHLSDFKGKLVILDLWSCFCHTCLSLFPHLDSLQRKYKDQLQVLLVNSKSSLYHDDAAKITRVMDRLQARTRMTIDLPIIHHNEELDAYFPAKSLPHEVWIDPQGKVIAITASTDVTELNIESILAGKKTEMHFKNDTIAFDQTLPLFINGNGGVGNEMKFRSLLTGYIEGIWGTGIESENEVMRYHSWNTSLFSLVTRAYPEYAGFNEHRFILESGNKILSPAPTDPAFYDNQYCYELIIPLADDATLRRYMQQDLQRYFNIKLQRKKRHVKCLVIQQLPNRRARKDTCAPDIDLERENPDKHIHHYPPSFIARFLNQYSAIPIIDETQLKEPISLDFPPDLSDRKGLIAAFRRAGLLLKEEDRLLEMIVISDH